MLDNRDQHDGAQDRGCGRNGHPHRVVENVVNRVDILGKTWGEGRKRVSPRAVTNRGPRFGARFIMRPRGEVSKNDLVGKKSQREPKRTEGRDLTEDLHWREHDTFDGAVVQGL